MSRPRISVFIAHSVDGYIATDDDSLDWLMAYDGIGEDYGFEAFMSDVDAIAMGRGTYDFIKDFPELPYGERPIYVFSTQSFDPREHFTFWARTPEEAVAEWEAAGIRHVYVDGGHLISQFLDAGFVDDLTLTSVPLLLGSGRPLFHRIGTSTPLRLVDTQAFPSGMLNRRYERA
jgi:dihydrofolate reductase